MNQEFKPTELERLQVLRGYEILDTAPEAEYDDIVSLAAQICETPLASITLVDEQRQWFKASVGYTVPETPRNISFCSRAMEEPDVMIVPDATLDPRFRDYSNVTGDPFIRFYAGAPLVTRDGWALGTLCVIDQKPRTLSHAQLQALRVLRRHVIDALELRRLVRAQRNMIADLERTKVALQEAKGAAEAGLKARSQFLAAMSHEIRTPMNAVLGMTTVLRTTSLDPEQLDCVNTIRTSGELLLTVINDILDFSKIESGKLEFEHAPFLVASCLGDAVDLLAAAAKEKNLTLTTTISPEVPTCVAGDVTRIRQVLVNLLSNAVKFTEKGGVHVEVNSRSCSDGSVELEFAVTDTGVGIPPDRADRLFQPFCQADASVARKFGGTGLGLAISRRLVELHGGEIHFESEPGRGTRFVFTIKATPHEATISRPAAKAMVDSSMGQRYPLKLLIAEDNQVNQKVARLLLAKLGYEATAVSNGIEALSMLRRSPYEVVLMDVEMPEMDGIEATRQIRSEFPPERQPIIVALTAHVLSECRQEYAAAGMDEFLSKPIRMEELVEIMRLCGTMIASRQEPT